MMRVNESIDKHENQLDKITVLIKEIRIVKNDAKFITTIFEMARSSDIEISKIKQRIDELEKQTRIF